MSQDSTSPDGTGCVTGQTVKSIEERDGHCRRYKHCMWVVKTTVSNMTLRMQAVVFILISTCISEAPVSEFSWVLMSTRFADLYRLRDRRNNEITPEQ